MTVANVEALQKNATANVPTVMVTAANAIHTKRALSTRTDA
jgi:hypothetical protein